MRLHLIDGTYELFRAHFSKRPEHRGRGGTDVKATIGVLYSLLALLDDPDERATHVAVAFDNPVRSFRNDMFDGYKTEAGVPQDLLAQFDLVERAVRAIGVTVWSMDQWEADDALATAAGRFAGAVEQVRILTPDKDLGQCLRGSTVVQVDRMRKKLIDEDGLRALRGVGPQSIPDYLALVGDTADGIPGLSGFGERSTSLLLGEYVHLEHIPADAAAWKPKVRGAAVLAQTLHENMTAALLYRKLATLVTTVPLKESLADLEWKGALRSELYSVCDELGAPTGLGERPKRFRD
jgi:5'-3' exonuclease